MSRSTQIKEFKAEQKSLEEKLDKVELQRKNCKNNDAWFELTRLRNVIRVKLDQVKRKIQNARERKNPWGTEINEFQNPNT